MNNQQIHLKKAVSELITPVPPIFILSYNHTFVLLHDISCVCMHPADESGDAIGQNRAQSFRRKVARNQTPLEKCLITRAFPPVSAVM